MVSRKEREKLYRASKNRHKDKVRFFLKKVTKSYILVRLLYKASKYSRENVTSLLFNRVTDPIAIEKARYIVTNRNYINIVSILLDKYPSLNARLSL